MARDIFGKNRRDPRVDDPEIRVTDRRRIQIDDKEPVDSNLNVEATSLKPSYVEELESRTQAAERKVQEINSRFEQLRKELQRETDETRQRLNKAADERAHRAKADFIANLLPVLDNLERAARASETGSSSSDVAEGVRRTAASFQHALAAAGVEPIEAVGQPFDPEQHDAVETVAADPDDEGKVLAEYSRGYRIGDRLLRPARVKVGRYSERAKA